MGAESMSRPYLAMVVASRNDDHGGDPLKRTEMAVRRFIWQCERYGLHGEYIVVDWNPPPDRPSLGEVFRGWNLTSKFCRVRVIRVPPEIHLRIPHSSKLPLFQMWAKNVGIRRAEAEFVLATNIDVMMSNQVMNRFAARGLSSQKMYRSDRFDVGFSFPEVFSHRFEDADAFSNTYRINKRGACMDISLLHAKIIREEGLFVSKEHKLQARLREKLRLFFRRKGIPLKIRSKYQLHTNACGDFTLMAQPAWEGLRGYPEIAAYSFHIDSILCAQAHNNGYPETILLYPEVHFHVDHADGWSPESDKTLFARLKEKRIPYLDGQLKSYEDYCRGSRYPVVFNSTKWGFADEKFHEDSI
jgi:hypothetical protein